MLTVLLHAWTIAANNKPIAQKAGDRPVVKVHSVVSEPYRVEPTDGRYR